MSETDAPSSEVTDAAFASAFLNNQATAVVGRRRRSRWTASSRSPTTSSTEGRYSDGVVAAEQIYHPGHDVKRLGDEFANAPIMVGNDEQYAAIMALLASNVGVPARVVMGAVVPEDGVVRRPRRRGLGGAPGRRRVVADAADRDLHEPRSAPPSSRRWRSRR